MKLNRIEYSNLNSRQKEAYNYQKVSAVLADYGYITIKLSDDWEGADFIGQHRDGSFIKVQLKGRLEVNTKYIGKGLSMCFKHKEFWYLGPHDDILNIVSSGISGTISWAKGKYSWNSPSKLILQKLEKYKLENV
jgi:hypothetical protein